MKNNKENLFLARHSIFESLHKNLRSNLEVDGTTYLFQPSIVAHPIFTENHINFDHNGTHYQVNAFVNVANDEIEFTTLAYRAISNKVEFEPVPDLTFYVVYSNELPHYYFPEIFHRAAIDSIELSKAYKEYMVRLYYYFESKNSVH